MLELQLSTIFFTVLNLLILYVLLKKFLFGRVNKVLEERAALVRDTLNEAEAEKAQADELKQEYEEKLAQAHTEATGILAQAKARGELEYQQIMASAKADAQRLHDQAKAKNKADREEMLRSARQEVAQLAVMAASKVAGRALDRETDRAILDDFLAEAGDKQ